MIGMKISMKDIFLENMETDNQRILYWEFHEQGGKQAVRKGNWKAVRLDVHEEGFHDDIELYNLMDDPSESDDIADNHPDIVEQMKTIMKQEHERSKNFPFRFEIEATSNE